MMKIYFSYYMRREFDGIFAGGQTPYLLKPEHRPSRSANRSNGNILRWPRHRSRRVGAKPW